MAKNSLWIMETGHAAFPMNHLYSGFYRAGEMTEMQMMMIYGESEDGHKFLVNPGIDLDVPENYEFIISRGYTETQCTLPYALNRFGVKPEEITDVFITHGHWDHMAAIPNYPNAQFYIMKKELFAMLEMLAMPKEFYLLTRCCVPKHYEDLFALIKEHRLTLLDGPVENLFSGVSVVEAPDGHTPDGLMVIVEGEKADGTKDAYICVGDAVYAKENVLGHPTEGYYLPTALHVAVPGIYGMLKTMDYLNKFCKGDISKIVIEHDIHTWERYETTVDEKGYHFAELLLAPGTESKL